MMILQLEHFQLAYDDIGQGNPVLLIHGYPLGRKMWAPQHTLSSQLRLVAPDLRGFGESGVDPAIDIHTMDLFADDCATLLDHLRIDEPITVCGLSMGGYIAFAFYRKYSQRVGKLVLASTRALPDSPETSENRLRAAALAEKEGSQAIARAMLPAMLSANIHESKPEVVAQVKQIMLESSIPGIVGALKGMRLRPDSTHTLSTITVPTLIVRGDDDTFAPLPEAKAMRDGITGDGITNAKLVRIPDAAHLPNLEQPQAFNQALLAFLAKD